MKTKLAIEHDFRVSELGKSARLKESELGEGDGGSLVSTIH